MMKQVFLAGTIAAAGVAFGARAVPERETVEANGVWEMAQATAPETKLKVKRLESAAGRTRLSVRNAGERIAFFVKVAPVGADSVGVRYSDNWFSLLPGESRDVTVSHPPRAYAWSAAAFLRAPVREGGN